MLNADCSSAELLPPITNGSTTNGGGWRRRVVRLVPPSRDPYRYVPHWNFLSCLIFPAIGGRNCVMHTEADRISRFGLSSYRSAGESDECDDDIADAISAICHDWSTYDSTYAAIPHLVEICGTMSLDSPTRVQLLVFVGWCVACLRLNKTTAPKDIIDFFEGSLPIASRLTAETLAAMTEFGNGDPRLRGLLASLAATHGDCPLAFVLYELDSGGYRCDHCNEFVRPLRSSMNPFWSEETGT